MNRWIRSPGWDLFWVLSMVPCSFLAWGVAEVISVNWTLAVVSIPLWGGHTFAPIFLAWLHPEFRKATMMESRKYLWLPLMGILLITFFGMMAGLGLTNFIGDQGEHFNGLILLLDIYVLWSSYHSAAQNFGVLSLYRARAGVEDQRERSRDRFFCFAIVCFIVPFGIVFPNEGLGHLLRQLGGYPSESFLLWTSRLIIFVSVALTAYMIFLEKQNWKSTSLARSLFIFNLGILPTLMFWKPILVFGYLINHWLVAISFAAQTLSMKQNSKVYEKFPVMVVGLIVVSLLSAKLLVLHSETARFTQGYIRVGEISAAIGALLGLRFAFGYLHFYYDRFLYGNHHAARKIIE